MLDEALKRLHFLPETQLLAVSSYWCTAPWGDVDQADFVNAVAHLQTGLSPRELLTALLDTEIAMGRQRDSRNPHNQRRWGPRLIDLDLLLYDGLEIDQPGLIVPHPRMAQRAFVLVPLLELAPDLAIAGQGSAARLLAALGPEARAEVRPGPPARHPLSGPAESAQGETSMTAAKPVTLPVLNAMKAEARPIVMLTTYDASFARVVDAAGVDVVLVGDSLGNVIQGRGSTLPVTVADMVYHTAAVRRGLSRALLLVDLPFMSYHDRDSAMESARKVMQAGAQMVKIEGGADHAPAVAALVANGVPVCAHLGLTPQHVNQLGGYRVQGRNEGPARKLKEDALALAAAGAGMLVLECVPIGLAAEVTEMLDIPVIGIGAGAEVDGQVLVLHDMLGITSGHVPKFVHNFMTEANSVSGAVEAYVQAVREGRFPTAAHAWE